MNMKQSSRNMMKTKIGDIAAFRILREFRKNEEGIPELINISQAIYYLGIVNYVDKKGKALSIKVGQDYYSDQGGFNYFVPKENLDYHKVIKALEKEKRYKKWTLDEIRAFLSPFLK